MKITQFTGNWLNINELLKSDYDLRLRKSCLHLQVVVPLVYLMYFLECIFMFWHINRKVELQYFN